MTHLPDPAFKVFTRNGVKFLAFPNGSGIVVTDELGRNHGSWLTLKTFDAWLKDGKPTALGFSRIGQIAHSATELPSISKDPNWANEI
jgi:hypothetical protein